MSAIWFKNVYVMGKLRSGRELSTAERDVAMRLKAQWQRHPVTLSALHFGVLALGVLAIAYLLASLRGLPTGRGYLLLGLVGFSIMAYVVVMAKVMLRSFRHLK